jgi:hypothetical protein
VAREQHRPRAAEPAHELADLDHLAGIEADRRLVEDQDRRIAEQCLREADALAVPFESAPTRRCATPFRSNAASTVSTAAARSARGMRFTRATKRRYSVTRSSG